MMFRTRLVWFTSGLTLTAGPIAYVIYRDLSSHRHLLLTQLKESFGALETRVANLETAPLNNPVIVQEGGSSN